MKKLLTLLFALLITISMVACGNSSEGISNTENATNIEETQSDNNNSNAKLSEFKKTAQISETLLVDENNIKITATSLSYNNYSADIELLIENNSDKDLSFISGSLGYCCNSINGYMISDGYLNCDIAAGKKANDSISFSYDTMMFLGITEIADIEIGFDISDDEYNHIYTGPRQLKTVIADSFDYNTNYYQTSIVSDASKNTFDYTLNFFVTDKLYEQNGVTVLSEGLMVNSDGNTALLLEVMNTSSDMLNITTGDISINGMVCYSTNWSTNTINPGKRSVIDIDLSSIFREDYWDSFGIKDINNVGLALSIKDMNSNVIVDSAQILVKTSDKDFEIDNSGTEVYNANGVRIVSKNVFNSDSEYSKDIDVIFLVENSSGKTISISDVYDSVSVNGFMTDYIMYSVELDDGESAVIKVALAESSLEENKITSSSDITDFEIELEIESNRDNIDEPKIIVNY